MARRSLLRALIVVAALGLGWLLRAVTVPLLAAYLLSLVLQPLRDRLAGRLGKSGAALAALAVGLLLPVVLALPVLFEIDELAALLPTVEQAQQFADRLLARIAELRAGLPAAWSAPLDLQAEEVQRHIQALAQHLAAGAAALLAFLGGFFGVLSGLLLVPIFLYFLLAGAPWLPRLRDEMPPEWRGRFDRILPRIERILGLYGTTRFQVAAIKGLIFLPPLWLAGIPGAYTLALFSGVFSLIPVLGPLIAALFLALVAFAAKGAIGLAVAAAAYVVAELVENYLLVPRLVGRGLGLSDFAVLLAVLAGGALLGVFGTLIAIPLVAVGKVLYDEYLRPVMGTEAPG